MKCENVKCQLNEAFGMEEENSGYIHGLCKLGNSVSLDSDGVCEFKQYGQKEE